MWKRLLKCLKGQKNSGQNIESFDLYKLRIDNEIKARRFKEASNRILTLYQILEKTSNQTVRTQLENAIKVQEKIILG